MTIQEIQSFEPYEDFIGELAGHPLYSDPHFTHDKENLYGSLKRKDELAFAVSRNGITHGLFVWLVLPEDRYIEMIIGLTRSEKAFAEMLSYLEQHFRGYHMDLVFNPQNAAISRTLRMKGAAFDPEQQKMILTRPTPNVLTGQIQPLSEKWAEQYCAIHSVNTYWTAQRILSAPDQFSVLLAIQDGQVQGYLDLQCCHDTNEIYDLYVTPEGARQGYGLALLAKAIEWNRPNPMMVVVDADAQAEIDLYTAAGFDRLEGQNSITASYQIKAL